MAADKLENGWFTDKSEMWPGYGVSLEVEKVLFDEKSDFQHILILQSKTFGKVLVLDGVIQCTDRDEYSYQEMMAHVPCFSHPNPKKVLLIGGGDGGVIRELSKNPHVEQIVQCEIDEKVIKVCKEYLPNMASGFSSPKLLQHIGDGFEFMKNHTGEFDVIITDSSDPIGPAESLFQKPYYELMKSALKPDGLLCCQGECIWLHMDLIKEMADFSKKLFPVVDYGFLTIPTYPAGQIGMILCSKNPETDFKRPLREPSNAELDSMKLRYYSPEAHRGAFMLPRFARQELSS
ncbi:spermidine synthase-like [Tubulanus polymorphus]|uniref:spermidine synthase-like n=1 Tax=Tubulanus polymorphus TaxID=672921 RepID=UPI003DA546DA